MLVTSAALIDSLARHQPDDIAVETGEQQTSYRQLLDFARGMTTKGRLFCVLWRINGQVKNWAVQNERIRRWAVIWRRRSIFSFWSLGHRSRERLSGQAGAAHSTITEAHDVKREARASEREQ
jgi:hypothetical protein